MSAMLQYGVRSTEQGSWPYWVLCRSLARLSHHSPWRPPKRNSLPASNSFCLPMGNGRLRQTPSCSFLRDTLSCMADWSDDSSAIERSSPPLCGVLLIKPDIAGCELAAEFAATAG